MKTKRFRVWRRDRLVSFALVSLALASLLVAPWSDTQAGTPTYSIDFHIISSGGTTLHGSCFVLSGTVAQVAPGYSAAANIYSLNAGYWQPAPTASVDEIFFNGFEGC